MFNTFEQKWCRNSNTSAWTFENVALELACENRVFTSFLKMNQKEYEIIHNLYPESTLTIKSKIHIKILGNDCWNYKLSTYYVILYTLKKSESWKNDWIHFQIQMSKNINHDITFHRIEVIMIKLTETFLVQWYSYVWKINVWTILRNIFKVLPYFLVIKVTQK